MHLSNHQRNPVSHRTPTRAGSLVGHHRWFTGGPAPRRTPPARPIRRSRGGGSMAATRAAGQPTRPDSPAALDRPVPTDPGSFAASVIALLTERCGPSSTVRSRTFTVKNATPPPSGREVAARGSFPLMEATGEPGPPAWAGLPASCGIRGGSPVLSATNSVPADGGGRAGRGWSSAVIPAQLTRTAAAVTDRWAPKNFHIAVDARGPRASLNDPLEEPPDQA